MPTFGAGEPVKGSDDEENDNGNNNSNNNSNSKKNKENVSEKKDKGKKKSNNLAQPKLANLQLYFYQKDSEFVNELSLVWNRQQLVKSL